MRYKIYKGWKFAFPPFPFISKKREIKRYVTFDESYKYDIGPEQDYIQKVLGISFDGVHNNSARFGARYVGDNQVQLLAYCYNKGVRLNTKPNELPICTVPIGVKWKGKICWRDNRFLFQVWVGTEYYKVYQPTTFIPNSKWVMIHRPYFEPKAPHTITIKITK